eukprot:Sdes_comp20932_c0_seq1m18364
MASPHQRNVSRLLRGILKAHRILPEGLRYVGDAYVKAEFRKHKSVAPALARSFLIEWQSYLGNLLEQASSQHGVVGKELSPSQMNSLTDEQIGQLYELKKATVKPGEE